MQPDLDPFHNELRAAILAKVPVRFGKGLSAPKIKLATIERLQNRFGDSQSGTLDSLDDLAPGDRLSRYRAANSVFAITGSMANVLDGLSIDIRVQKQLTALVRAPLWYLLMMIFVAYLGLFLFSVSVVPTFESFRSDLQFPLVIDAPERTLPAELMTTISLLLGMIALFGCVFLLCGGAKFVPMLLGGQLYYRSQLNSSVIRVIQSLVACGTDVDRAIKLACQLIGFDPKTGQEVIQAVGSRTGGQPADGGAEHTDRLDGLYQHYQQVARSRLATLRIVIPSVIVVIVGGTLVVLYSLAIFTPVVDLIHDLSLPGTVS